MQDMNLKIKWEKSNYLILGYNVQYKIMLLQGTDELFSK